MKQASLLLLILCLATPLPVTADRIRDLLTHHGVTDRVADHVAESLAGPDRRGKDGPQVGRFRSVTVLEPRTVGLELRLNFE